MFTVRTFTCVVLASIAVAATLAGGAAAIPRAAVPASSQKITPAGAGKVKLGETYARLRARHLVGSIKRGCELAGPRARSASLSPPLKGSVDFTTTLPRKVPAITAAFPKAKVDHSTDSTFGVTLVRIPKHGGGRLQFAVDTRTHKVVLIGIPLIAFCE